MTTEASVTHSTAFKVGVAILTLLSLSDLVSVVGLGSDNAPPTAVTVLGGLLGLVSLVALPVAYRSPGPARVVLLVSRVLSALLGIPAFFVDDAPSWAPPLVGVSLVLTAAGVALVGRGEHRAVTE